MNRNSAYYCIIPAWLATMTLIVYVAIADPLSPISMVSTNQVVSTNNSVASTNNVAVTTVNVPSSNFTVTSHQDKLDPSDTIYVVKFNCAPGTTPILKHSHDGTNWTRVKLTSDDVQLPIVFESLNGKKLNFRSE